MISTIKVLLHRSTLTAIAIAIAIAIALVDHQTINIHHQTTRRINMYTPIVACSILVMVVSMVPVVLGFMFVEYVAIVIMANQIVLNSNQVIKSTVQTIIRL
jgi:hypothetical protein